MTEIAMATAATRIGTVATGTDMEAGGNEAASATTEAATDMGVVGENTMSTGALTTTMTAGAGSSEVATRSMVGILSQAGDHLGTMESGLVEAEVDTEKVPGHRRGGVRPPKEPFRCRKGEGRHPDGTCMLRATNNIQLCKLSRQVFAAFSTSRSLITEKKIT
jgi:hypothetical protein